MSRRGRLLRGRAARLLALLALAGAGPVAGSAEAELLPVRHPSLEMLEPAVREQLRSERAFFDQLLARGDVDPATLGRAHGALGQLYLVYDFIPVAETCFLNARRLLPEEFPWPYYLGVVAAGQGEFDRARARFEEALAMRPGDLPTLIRLGRVELDTDRLESAEERFREALERAPDSAAALHGLGRAALAAGRPEEAVAHLERALELQPEADSIHHPLGLAHRRLGDLDAARHHLGLNRHGEVLFPDPLLDDLAPLVRSAQLHFEMGVEALRQDQIALAIEHLEKAAAIDEEDFLTRHYLALAAMASGSEERAMEEFRAAIERNPGYAYSHFNLASLLARHGDHQQAAVHFGEAHRLDPEDPVAHQEWATALSRIGREREAEEELAALLEAHPDHAPARLHLGILQAGSGRWEEARGHLERVLAGTGVDGATRAEAHRQLAALAARQGRSDEELAAWRAALEIEPDSEATRHALALALGRSGRYREAAAEFARLLERAPEELRYHFGRSMALLLAGDHAPAREAIEGGLERLPGELRLTHLLARFLATCPEAALRDGARALELARLALAREESLEHAETVAMALAELGRFEEAASWQREVVDRAERAGEVGLAERARRRLAAYESGRPERAPWGSGG